MSSHKYSASPPAGDAPVRALAQAKIDGSNARTNAPSLSDVRSSGDQEKASPPAHMAFPDGGLRAWSVAAGHAGAMFCTFGYINSFGFVKPPFLPEKFCLLILD